MMPSHRVLFLVLLMLQACPGCDPKEVLRNPEIERWCGERPCFWHVKGTTERVGTWNRDDYAIALISNHAELWQETGYVGAAGIGQCFSVTMLTKIDPGVRVYLDVEFTPGTSTKVTRRIPESDYEPVTFEIAPPSWFEHARFTIRKDGSGRAVIAKLRVLTDDELSCGSAQVALNDRPAGAYCDVDRECESGDCHAYACTCPPGVTGEVATGPDAGVTSCACLAGDDDGGCP